jgi:hypothetical protein
MSLANPGWGAVRIHGELLKLGFELSQATVAKYLVRHRKPPSQNWRTFLNNHMQSLVSADFFVVPTITFRLLFVFVILSHDRHRPLPFAITKHHPTAGWAARQLSEAFPWVSAPRYLLRDRDRCYGEEFHDSCVGRSIHPDERHAREIGGGGRGYARLYHLQFASRNMFAPAHSPNPNRAESSEGR